jgi:hypothetical protein
MADDVTPSADPNNQKRETLRVTLPPRPLKPDSTQLSRPNSGTAATIPLKSSDRMGAPVSQGGTPAWSTAVTQPMQKPARPPTGLVAPTPSQIKQSASLTGSRAKTEPLVLPTAANPRSLAPSLTSSSASKTAMLRPGPGFAAPVNLPPPLPVGTGRVPTSTGRVPTATGRVNLVPPRVIIANPQAKVFVSGKTDILGTLDPVQHSSRPPALPATGTLPMITKDTVGMPRRPESGLSETARTPLPELPLAETLPPARVPETLAPQPPLVSPSQTSSAPGFTPPLGLSPAAAPNMPLPIAKSAPIMAPSVRPPAIPSVPPPVVVSSTAPVAATPSVKPPTLAPLVRRSGMITPPVSSPTASLPMIPRTGTITPPPAPLTPSSSSPGAPTMPPPLTAKKSTPIVPPVEPIMRKSASLLPPSPAEVKSAPTAVSSDPARKSSVITPPVEPLLRKSARLFQPPLPEPAPATPPAVEATPPQDEAPLRPAAVMPILAAVVAKPASLAPLTSPVKRSSRIILPGSQEREATPVVKTPPAMNVVPPVSSTGRILPVPDPVYASANTILKESTPTSTPMEPTNASPTPPPPPLTPAGGPPTVPPSAMARPPFVSPPPVKPMTARLDQPPATPPPVNRLSTGTAQIEGKPGTVAPPRRTQSISMESMPPSPVNPPAPPSVMPAIKPVAPPVGSALPVTAPPVVKPVVPAASSAMPSVPPPAPVVKPLMAAAVGAAAGALAASAAKPTMPPPAPVPVSTVKPVVPGAPSPVKPVMPGAIVPVPIMPVKPIAPGSPLKPASAVPAVVAKSSDKTGTQAVKTPPPKETARITVKPSLPTARPAGVANIAGVKPAVVAAGAAVPVVAAVATPGKKVAAVPVAGIPAFEEEKSTTMTTAVAFALVLLTWGTAGILIASFYRML